MKTTYLFVVAILLSLAAMADEPIVKQAIVSVTNANLRVANAIVLSTLPFDAPSSGRVVLRFDGYCVSDSGDRIIVAASNIPDWGTNDGAVAVMAPHPDFKRRAFSHTRVYDITAGADTFYAVAQNYVNEQGSGVASVYGHLTLEFFPAAGPAMVIYNNLDFFNEDVRTAQRVVSRIFSPDEPAGKVLVHADGYIYSDVGDRIMLTAANVPSWLVGDGSVAVMAYNATQRYSPFSHTQAYTQNTTPDSFYTTVRNVVNASGSGIASVYGNLSAQFFPTSGIASLTYHGVEKDDVQARGATVAFDSITITAPTDGFALAQLDGYCTSSVGDEFLFAVNSTPAWQVDEGHITVSAAYTNNNFSTLSHSRLFPVSAGTHKYYCVTENKGKTMGNGLVDIAATFTVKFYPDVNVGINRIENAPVFQLLPNPANNTVTVLLNDNHTQRIDISDMSGRLIQSIETGNQPQLQVNIAHLTAGIYLVKSGNYTLKLIKQ